MAFWYSTMKTDKEKQLKEEILIKPIIRILTHFTLDGWKAVGRAFFLCVVSRNEAHPLAISWSPRTVWSKVLISNLLWVASDLSVLMESETCSQVLPSRQLGKSSAYHCNMKQQQCVNQRVLRQSTPGCGSDMFRSIPDSIFTFPVVWKGEVMNVSETAKQMLHSGNWKYFGRHGWCPLVT